MSRPDLYLHQGRTMICAVAVMLSLIQCRCHEAICMFDHVIRFCVITLQIFYTMYLLSLQQIFYVKSELKTVISETKRYSVKWSVMLSHCMPPSTSYSRESHGRVCGVVSVESPPPLRPPRPGNLPSAPGLDNKKAPPSFTNTGTGIQTPTEGSRVTSD